MKIEHLTNANFSAELTQAVIPVLVDFYADWCGPCKGLAPVLEELAVELEGKVRIYKVNVDAAPELASRYRIRGVPTMILFHHGEEIDRLVGALPKAELSRALAAVQQ